MSAADKLAQVLAEHYAMGVSAEGVVECTCGDGFVDFEIDHDPTPEHCAHVAAVVLAHITADGWAQGREEWGVRLKLSPTRSTVQRHKTEESARAVVAESMRPDLLTLVHRRVTDWEPVEGEHHG